MSDEAKEVCGFPIGAGGRDAVCWTGEGKTVFASTGSVGLPEYRRSVVTCTVDLWSEIPSICGHLYRRSVVISSCIDGKFGPDSEAISGGYGPPTY